MQDLLQHMHLYAASTGTDNSCCCNACWHRSMPGCVQEMKRCASGMSSLAQSPSPAVMLRLGLYSLIRTTAVVVKFIETEWPVAQAKVNQYASSLLSRAECYGNVKQLRSTLIRWSAYVVMYITGQDSAANWSNTVSVGETSGQIRLPVHHIQFICLSSKYAMSFVGPHNTANMNGQLQGH